MTTAASSKARPAVTPRRRGVVMVLIAGSLASFLTLVALVVDVGYLYARQAHMQASVDVAALSALSACDASLPAPRQAARLADLCRTVLTANGLAAARYRVEVLASRDPAIAAQITIEGRERLPAFFARVVGWGGFDVAVASRATVRSAGSAGMRAALEQ